MPPPFSRIILVNFQFITVQVSAYFCHFMCHRELREAFEESYETINDFGDEIEQQANIFASCLLMPSNLIRAEIEHLGWETTHFVR